MENPLSDPQETRYVNSMYRDKMINLTYWLHVVAKTLA